MSELCSQEQNYFMYQPISFHNLPEKMIVRQTTSCKKCLLCLISFLDFILFLKTDPRIGKFLAPAAHRPCWGFAKEGFGLAYMAHPSLGEVPSASSP